MTTTEPTRRKNLDGYDAPEIEWKRVLESFDLGKAQGPGAGGPNRHTYWVATVNPDGRPHVVPVGVWFDGEHYYFTSGPGTRKSKNLAERPACTLTVSVYDFDLVIEGDARIVTDNATLEKVAAEAREGGWPAEVRDGAFTAPFSAPSAGPPPWHLYEVTPKTTFALGTSEPYGAERFDF